MKSKTLNLLVGLLLASASHTVFAMDDAACRAGYSTMLLTQKECTNWMSTRTGLKKRNDSIALKQLDDKMRKLMADRAEVCPCAWDRALQDKMLEKSAGF